MKIGLVDVDGRVMRGKKSCGKKFPNLALMKLYAWHKSKGDDVEFAVPLKKYDIVYRSKVFTFTPDDNIAWMAKSIVSGGTGYGLFNDQLPNEVEHMMPDYSLYDIEDEAHGFLTRGCPRGCKFCIVGKKEGLKSQKVANLDEFWRGQKFVKLYDPNILACVEWRDLLGQLIDSRAWIDFTQGVDIRLLTDESADMIAQIKTKMLHFAWDGTDDLEPRFKQFAPYFKHLLSGRRLRAFVLVNFNTSHEYDLHRIKTLDALGYDPFVMVYDKDNAPHITRKLA